MIRLNRLGDLSNAYRVGDTVLSTMAARLNYQFDMLNGSAREHVDGYGPGSMSDLRIKVDHSFSYNDERFEKFQDRSSLEAMRVDRKVEIKDGLR